MTKTTEVLEEGLRLLPELAQAKQVLERGAQETVTRSLRAEAATPRSRAIIGVRSPAAARANPLDAAVKQRREQLLEAAKSAVDKLAEHGKDAELDEEESDGLEAIINLTARPAIRLENGTFADPVAPWDDLGSFRPAIQETAARVGRVEVHGNPLIPFGGTAFVVADGMVMTNRHVAHTFADSAGGEWTFEPGMKAGVNYAEDPDTAEAPEFSVKRVVGVHPRFDMAILEVDAASGELPSPVTIASEGPDSTEPHRVYAMGYPALDPRNGAEAMRVIFGDVYNVKRVQPGQVMSVAPEDGVFHHDCSTLGGNSGSCVVDLETNRVLGLHFSGKYLKYNRAVALWQLRKDPLLAGIGVTFG